MRSLFVKLLVVVFLILICNSVFSGQDLSSLSEKQYAVAEQNFMKGLESNSIGMRANSIFYLGEMKSQTAASYLIHIIHNDKCAACRIIAALSLFKIGDKTGIHEIKKIREFAPPDPSNDNNYILYLSVLWNQYLTSHSEESLVLKNIRFPNDVNKI
jgi:hypothetical protein